MCWDGETMVGGLYGAGFDHAFCGESMFSRATDASKVALVWLVALLRRAGYTLLDCQFMTEHLASLGAVAVPRDDYVALLGAAVSGAGDSASGGGSSAEFGALDRLLDTAGPDGAAGGGGPGGKLIAQLLGQMS